MKKIIPIFIYISNCLLGPLAEASLASEFYSNVKGKVVDALFKGGAARGVRGVEIKAAAGGGSDILLSGKKIAEMAPGRNLQDFGPDKIAQILNAGSSQAMKGIEAQYKGLTLMEKVAFQIAQANREFPFEAWAFFVAIGAIKTFNLITKYHDDPLALKHHFEEQSDPVGLFSFYAFMQSSGIFGVVLQQFLKGNGQSPLAGTVLSFLTMGIGTIAQSYAGQVLHDKDFLGCVNEGLQDSAVKKWEESSGIKQKANRSPCSQLYDALVTRHNWTKIFPDVLSMTVAAFISHWTQANLVKLGTSVADTQFFRLMSIRLANFAIPGAGLMTAVAYVFTNQRVTNALLFLIPNGTITQPTTDWIWENMTNAMDMRQLEQDMVREILKEKNSHWNLGKNPRACINSEQKDDSKKEIEKNCEKDLAFLLGQFATAQSEWRHFLLQDIYQAHEHWLQFLTNFWNQYRGSYQVYSEFINQVRDSKGKQDSNNSRFNLIAPLHGVQFPAELELAKLPNTPENQTHRQELQSKIDESRRLLYDNPGYPEVDQWYVVHEAGKTIRDFLSSISSQSLRPSELRALNYLSGIFYKPEIEQQLRKVDKEGGYVDIDSDLMKKGKALEYFNELYPSMSALNIQTTSAFKVIMNQLKKILGNPEPILEPGKGWMVSFEENAPIAKENKVQYTDPHRRRGTVPTPLITDYSLVSMVCGPSPERGEALADGITPPGFPTNFLPPRLVEPNEPQPFMLNHNFFRSPGRKNQLAYNVNSACESIGVKRESIYLTKLVDKENPDRIYRGYLDYMRENLRTDLQASPEVFEKWWLKNVETDAKKWMDTFNSYYLKLIAQLARRFKDSGQDSSISDSIRDRLSQVGSRLGGNQILPLQPLESARQEVAIYLLILNELYKSKIQQGKDGKIGDKYQPIKISKWSKFLPDFLGLSGLTRKNSLNLFSEVLKSPNSDFEFIAMKGDPEGLKKAGIDPASIQPVEWAAIGEVRSLFNGLYTLLKRLTPVKRLDGNALASSVSDDEFMKLQETLNSKISEIAGVFKVGTGLAEANGSLPDLNPNLNEASTRESAAVGAAIKGLQTVSQELISLGKIANVATFKGEGSETVTSPGQQELLKPAGARPKNGSSSMLRF